ncbi:hypothetical protein E4U22_001870, partial [Claviceps purpurea]
ERSVIESNGFCDDASAARTARGSAPGGLPEGSRRAPGGPQRVAEGKEGRVGM